jgi:hypothetical protein
MNFARLRLAARARFDGAPLACGSLRAPFGRLPGGSMGFARLRLAARALRALA